MNQETVGKYVKRKGLRDFRTLIDLCMEEDSIKEYNRVKFQLTHIYQHKPCLFNVLLTGALLLQEDLPKRKNKSNKPL